MRFPLLLAVAICSVSGFSADTPTFTNRDTLLPRFQELAEPVYQAFVTAVNNRAPKTAATPEKKLRVFMIVRLGGSFTFWCCATERLELETRRFKENGVSPHWMMHQYSQQYDLGSCTKLEPLSHDTSNPLWIYEATKIMEYLLVRAKEEGVFKELPMADDWLACYGHVEESQQRFLKPGKELPALKDWTFPPYLNGEDLEAAVQSPTPPKEMIIFGEFRPKRELKITAWPEKVHVRGIFYLEAHDTESLPKTIIANSVSIMSCSNIKHWPESITTKLVLLNGCKSFREVPAHFDVNSFLVGGSPLFTHLPARASGEEVEVGYSGLESVDPGFRAQKFEISTCP